MKVTTIPSYIEPYQGAATGVGGILRDVFTMGARPIALLNSIHFGSPEHPKTKNYLMVLFLVLVVMEIVLEYLLLLEKQSLMKLIMKIF